jgi:hypothetical protein
MMSSVIPARLQFQCGHAALVTLPRVKGETTAQRNERIAREKDAALARQCDFCGPAVEVTAVANGTHAVAADLADVIAAEPVAIATPAVAQPAPAPVVIEEIPEPAVLVVEPVMSDGESNGAVEPPAPVILAQPILAQTTPRTRKGTNARFVVRYKVDRVLRAVDIRDAIRQAQALGAGEVLSITREG